MTEDELALIRRYTHQREIYGRSAAIRALVEAGLKAEEVAGRFDPNKN